MFFGMESTRSCKKKFICLLAIFLSFSADFYDSLLMDGARCGIKEKRLERHESDHLVMCYQSTAKTINFVDIGLLVAEDLSTATGERQSTALYK